MVGTEFGSSSSAISGGVHEYRDVIKSKEAIILTEFFIVLGF